MRMAYFTLLIFPAVFMLLMLAEQVVPLRQKTRPLFQRLVKNLVLTAAVFLVGSLVVRNAGLGTSEWTAERSFGVIFLVPLPDGFDLLLLASGKPSNTPVLAISQCPPHRSRPGCFHFFSLSFWRDRLLCRFPSGTDAANRG